MKSNALHETLGVKTLPVRSHDGTQKIDYGDPFVRALLSPAIIRRIREILAEGEVR